ncbi:ExbD/TolR family protein [Maricaulis sp.]|uniref:ExbD/TolR family protein n=1 Tax=Maricaulis sp. TaxID=1486257 RepID=UPI003A935532
MSGQADLIARQETRRPPVEAALPLINIVFLLLTFFLMAGSLQSPIEKSIMAPTQAVEFDDVEFSPGDWLYLAADGRLVFRGEEIALTDIAATLIQDRGVLFADAQTPGGTVNAMLRAYEDAGSQGILLITARETPADG